MKVKIWNDNKHVYREKFKGVQIAIEPGAYVTLDEDDAHLFMGSYAPIVTRGDGQPDPRYFKKLRLDRSGVETSAMKAESKSDLTCQKCKYTATSQTDLSEHALLAHERDMFEAEDVKKALRK